MNCTNNIKIGENKEVKLCHNTIRLIYSAFGPTLAAKKPMRNGLQQNVQKQARSFWKCGNGCDISHGRASSPVQGFGNVFLGRLPKPTKTTLPQIRSTWLFWLLQNLSQLLLAAGGQQGCSDLALSPKWDIRRLFHLEDDVNHLVAVVVGRPTLEEGASHRLAISEQNYTARFD